MGLLPLLIAGVGMGGGTAAVAIPTDKHTFIVHIDRTPQMQVGIDRTPDFEVRVTRTPTFEVER